MTSKNKLTNNEIYLLEHLTYLGSSVLSNAKNDDKLKLNINNYKGQSVRTILELFTDDDLNNLIEKGDKRLDGWISAKEWADVISTIKKNDHLCELQLTNTLSNDVGVVALAFEDKKDPSTDAIVAFSGTKGANDWADNGESICLADTKQQIEALNFIESLPYENITVTGHSKGGNKAMYVTILSDKIKHCLSFDGEGFSVEFMDKYACEIAQRAHLINNWSLSKDFVNRTLLQLPNSKQEHFKGYGIDPIFDIKRGIKSINFFDFVALPFTIKTPLAKMFDFSEYGENHKLSAFYKRKNDQILLKNGQIIMDRQAESSISKYQDGFTRFVLMNSDASERKKIGKFFKILAPKVLSDEEWTLQEKIQVFINNREAIYSLAKFLYEYNKYLVSQNVDVKLIDKFNKVIIDKMFSFLPAQRMLDLLDDAKKSIDDGIDFSKKFFEDISRDIGFYVENMFEGMKIAAEEKSLQIKEYFKHLQPASSGSVIADFSDCSYNILLNTITRINSISLPQLKSWHNYKNEPWFNEILVENSIHACQLYDQKIANVNSISRSQISSIYSDVLKSDIDSASKISEINNHLLIINNKLNDLISRLSE